MIYKIKVISTKNFPFNGTCLKIDLISSRITLRILRIIGRFSYLSRLSFLLCSDPDSSEQDPPSSFFFFW